MICDAKPCEKNSPSKDFLSAEYGACPVCFGAAAAGSATLTGGQLVKAEPDSPSKAKTVNAGTKVTKAKARSAGDNTDSHNVNVGGRANEEHNAKPIPSHTPANDPEGLGMAH
jgi:hypothetical protein